MVSRLQTTAVFTSFISIGNEVTCNSVNRKKEPVSKIVFSLGNLHRESAVKDATFPSKVFATPSTLGEINSKYYSAF